MAELPEQAIEDAEVMAADHAHEGLADDPDSLRAHLGSEHHLDAPDHLSSATLRGLHDRLHHETGAADQ
jgi:hypothetical protein